MTALEPPVPAALEGAAAGTGATTRSPSPSGRWCRRHGVMGMGRGCVFCEVETAVFLDDGGIEEGDEVRQGMAVHEVVRGPGGRLVLSGPVNRCADGGLL